MENSTVQETNEVQSTPTGQIETRTVTTNSSLPDLLVSKTNQIIFLLVTIINSLIALRFVFLLLGANRVGIVDFIILITEVFVLPFKGIFNSPYSGNAYFEVASIFAIIVWTIVGIILGMAIKIFSNKSE